MHLAGSDACNGDPLRDAGTIASCCASPHRGNRSFGRLGSADDSPVLDSPVLDSTFIGNGSLGVYDHHLYVSGAGNGMRVAEHRLFRSTPDAGGDGNAVSLVGAETWLPAESDLLFADGFEHLP